ncbi:MAG: M14 family zinc carboxypeptidase [Gemmatimonadota bacterium]
MPSNRAYPSPRFLLTPLALALVCAWAALFPARAAAQPRIPIKAQTPTQSPRTAPARPVAEAPAADPAAAVPTPREHFGFAMGTDRELARWDEILDYFNRVAEASSRVRVDTLGPTTLGNPYVVVTLTAPENLARLAEIRTASARMARGRIAEEEARALAANLPVTVVINHNIHSTEIASSQTSVDMVYRLAAARDPETLAILHNVVTVLIPSANPDGQIMVTDWYRRNVGTEWEDARMPYLYHHYAGHDNNRDFFQGNLVETRYWMKVMYGNAFPQLYLDQHQMGQTGPRIFVPPYPDPMDPDVHPLVWQSVRELGGGMAADLERAGKKGVITAAMYRIWGQEGALTGRHHNIPALLTESASADIASPVTITREQLDRGARRLGPGARYGFNMSFADPWWGGTWTLGDIVDYQTTAAFSFLRQAAEGRRDFVFGRWRMARESMERARHEGPFAWVVPADQADPVRAADMMRRLAMQGIEVHRAENDFQVIPAHAGPRPQDGDPEHIAKWARGTDMNPADAGGEDPSLPDEDTNAPDPAPRTISAGSWVVLAAQPSWAAVEDLLMPQAREVRREWPGGPFRRSYDGAAYTMPLQMGVETLLTMEPFEAELAPAPAGSIHAPARALPSAEEWYALSTAVNESYRVANLLLADGVALRRTRDHFLIPAASARAAALLREEVRTVGLPVTEDPEGTAGGTAPRGAAARETPGSPISRARIGLYQGWASSMDEGWTRFLLEEYAFDAATLSNEDVRSPDLSERFDVVILPSEIPLTRLMEGADEEQAPEGFRGGIGEEGVENLKRFVTRGGTLVTLDRGDQVVLEYFGVPVEDALEDAPRDELFTPASLYRMEVDREHPLSAGTDAQVPAKWARGRAYAPSDFEGEGGRIRTVARWAKDPASLLLSGAVAGAEYLAGKAAILDVEYGAGHILMYGFRVQHRAQTAGTYRLLFNALFRGA